MRLTIAGTWTRRAPHVARRRSSARANIPYASRWVHALKENAAAGPVVRDRVVHDLRHRVPAAFSGQGPVALVRHVRTIGSAVRLRVATKVQPRPASRATSLHGRGMKTDAQQPKASLPRRRRPTHRARAAVASVGRLPAAAVIALRSAAHASPLAIGHRVVSAVRSRHVKAAANVVRSRLVKAAANVVRLRLVKVAASVVRLLHVKVVAVRSRLVEMVSVVRLRPAKAAVNVVHLRHVKVVAVRSHHVEMASVARLRLAKAAASVVRLLHVKVAVNVVRLLLVKVVAVRSHLVEMVSVVRLRHAKVVVSVVRLRHAKVVANVVRLHHAKVEAVRSHLVEMASVVRLRLAKAAVSVVHLRHAKVVVSVVRLRHAKVVAHSLHAKVEVVRSHHVEMANVVRLHLVKVAVSAVRLHRVRVEAVRSRLAKVAVSVVRLRRVRVAIASRSAQADPRAIVSLTVQAVFRRRVVVRALVRVGAALLSAGPKQQAVRCFA